MMCGQREEKEQGDVEEVNGGFRRTVAGLKRGEKSTIGASRHLGKTPCCSTEPHLRKTKHGVESPTETRVKERYRRLMSENTQ